LASLREALFFNLADWTIYHDAGELRLMAKVLMDFRESLVSTAEAAPGI
jgi:hypothetical protein